MPARKIKTNEPQTGKNKPINKKVVSPVQESKTIEQTKTESTMSFPKTEEIIQPAAQPAAQKPSQPNLFFTRPPSLSTHIQTFSVELIPNDKLLSLVDLNFNEAAINLLILKLEQVKETYNLQRLAWLRETVIKSSAATASAATTKTPQPSADGDIL